MLLVNGATVVETNNQATNQIAEFAQAFSATLQYTRCIETAHFLGCRIWVDTSLRNLLPLWLRFWSKLGVTQLKSVISTSSAAVDTWHVCT